MLFSLISRTLIHNVRQLNRQHGRTILKLSTFRFKHQSQERLRFSQIQCLLYFPTKTVFYSTGKQSNVLPEHSAKNETDEVLTKCTISPTTIDQGSTKTACSNSGSAAMPDEYLQSVEKDMTPGHNCNYDENNGYKLLPDKDNSDTESEIIPEQYSELQPIPKQTMEPEFHLSAYVNESETLTQLVRLGVDLTEVQKVKGAADMIIKLNFENQVKPYLFFLHDVGVSDTDMGKYISKNPLIFREDLEDLQARVNYLKSKKFTREAVSRIVSKAYVFLLMPVKTVDTKLGYLQREYRLKGDEVRSVVTRQPKLISWNLQKLKDNRFYIKEFLGFSDSELTQLMISSPKIFLTNRYSLGKKFDYVYNTMQINHKTMLEWPNFFRTRLHIIQQRHRFLLSVNRAQYDPTKENFVSLKALVSGTDKEFCKTVARVSVTQYNNFLKTI